MRYLVLAAVFLYITFTLGTAFAAPPKVGDVAETIYACKTEESLDTVLTTPGEEDFNASAQLAVDVGLCIRAPEGSMIMSPVLRLLKTYHLKWAPLVLYSFTTKSGDVLYYTFAYEPSQGV